MPKSRPPYPPEFRRRMVELVRAGRTPEDLGREFEPRRSRSATGWRRPTCDEGRRDDGLTTDEREELRRLRRENAPAARRAGDPGKSRGLVCSGDRLDPAGVFEFVKANQAVHRSPRCAACWASPPAATTRGGQQPSFGASEGGCRADGADPGHSRSGRGDVRGRPGSTRIWSLRALGVGRKRVARLMRAAGLEGVSRRQARPDHGARPRGAPGAGPGRARLRRDGPRPALGRRHHLHSDLGGLPLPGRGAGRLEPPGRGLGDGHASAHRARAGGAEHGAGAAPPRGGDPSLRPGLPVHLHRLRPALPGGRRAPVDGLGRRLLTTTLCARASSPRSSASCSTASASTPRPKRGWPSSTSSRAGTTRTGGTPRSATSARLTSRSVGRRRSVISAGGALRVSVGPCCWEPSGA